MTQTKKEFKEAFTDGWNRAINEAVKIVELYEDSDCSEKFISYRVGQLKQNS